MGAHASVAPRDGW
jgi:hypothetical protein